MFSAYDLKKIIPRAIFALVAVNLSWGLMEIFIKGVGLLGEGAKDLVTAPFTSAGIEGIQLGGGGGGAGGLVLTLAGLAALGVGFGLIPILGVAITGLFGILFAFVIALLRRVMLIGLVMIAPIAIALSVFPQTESWAKKWWEWFSKLLLMYPFVMAFFGLSEVAAAILSNMKSTGSAGFDAQLYDLAAIAVLVAPYFLVGKALSLAGGAIGKVAGMVNNKDKGIIDKTKKWEAGKVAERRVDAKAGARYSDNAFTRPINRALRRGLNPKETLSLSAAGRGAAAIRAQESAAAALAKAHPELENLTDDEAELLSMGSKSAARGRIDRRVSEAVARGEDGAALKRKLDLAMATAEQKAGGFDSVAAQVALPKAVKAGRIASHELDEVAANIAHGAVGAGAQQGVLKEHLLKTSEAGYKESGSVLHTQLAARDPSTGTRKANGALSSVIDASDDAARSAAIGSLSASDRSTLHSTVNATFDGSGKIGLEKVGAMDGNSRKTVIASKREQVESTISDFNAGTITAAEAVQRLAGHRADILTLAQASTDAKNSEGINDSNAALAAIDRSIAASAAGIAGHVQTATAPVFQSRMGSAGNRPL
jgi:hypothetical protein